MKSLNNKIFLKRRLYALKVGESTSITDQINTLNTKFSQVTAYDFNIAENELVEFLL